MNSVRFRNEVEIRLRSKNPILFLSSPVFPEDVAFLGAELAKEENDHVSTLEVYLIADAAQDFGTMIANSRIKCVGVLSSQLGDEHAAPVIRGAAKSKVLQRLVLVNVHMTSASVDVLIDLVRESQSLRILEVAYNKVEEGVRLIEAVVDEGRISRVSLDSNDVLCNERFFAALQSKRNKALQSISLAHSKIDSGGYKALSELLSEEHGVLREISLESCLDGQGMALVCKALQRNKGLRSLCFASNNSTQEHGVGKLVGDMLRSNTGLMSLDFRWFPLAEDEDWKEMLYALKSNTTLKILLLRGCDLPAAALGYLAEVLQVNSTLFSLDISGQELPNDDLIAFVKYLVGNKHISRLQLPFLEESVTKACYELLLGNGAIVECGGEFEEIRKRNVAMHQSARKAAIAVLMIRWRQEEETLLHKLPKDIVKIIARHIIDTKTEVSSWAK